MSLQSRCLTSVSLALASVATAALLIFAAAPAQADDRSKSVSACR